MLYKQTIRAGEVREINKEGRYFKLVNAQTALDLRVFKDGSPVLESEVRAGFEVSFNGFDKITIRAEQEQRIEIWASLNPLGYDAPSQNANNLSSGSANHYGDTDLLLPFEPNRLSAKVISDSPWWYGGSNVDKENGIPVAAGEIAEIRGAAEISAAIGVKGEYLPVNSAVRLDDNELMYSMITNKHGIFAINNDSKLVKVTLAGRELVSGIPDGYLYSVCNVGDDSIAFTMQYKNYIYELNLATGKMKYIALPKNGASADYVGELRNIAYIDGRYVGSTNGKDIQTGDTFSSIVVYDGSSWVHKMKQLDTTSQQFDQVFSLSGTDIMVYSNAFYVLDIDNMPEIEDLSTREQMEGYIGGLTNYMQFTYSDDYYLATSPGVNSECIVFDKVDYSATKLGFCDAAVVSNAGVLLLHDGKFKVTKDLGNTFDITDAPHDFSNGARTFMTYYNGVLFALGSSFLGYYVTEKQRVTPKQTFRVLKAYA